MSATFGAVFALLNSGLAGAGAVDDEGMAADEDTADDEFAVPYNPAGGAARGDSWNAVSNVIWIPSSPSSSA